MATIQTTEPAGIGTNGVPAILPLQNGDRLSREEFHRRYEAMPHVKKAELIEGVVYMPSPVIHKQHGNPNFDMVAWFGFYVAHTPGTEGGSDSSLKLDMINEPQPDGFLIVKPEFGGQVRFDEKGYIVGAPELIGEVSASSASYDLHAKKQAYRRNQVQEYIVWRVLERAIDWFVLDGADYASLPIDNGFYRSRVFPGLWLDVQALLDGDLRRVFEIVQQGVASEEHQRFVELLKQRSSSK